MMRRLFRLTSPLAFSPWLAVARFRNLSRSTYRIACYSVTTSDFYCFAVFIARYRFAIISAVWILRSRHIMIASTSVRAISMALKFQLYDMVAWTAYSWNGIDIIRSLLDTFRQRSLLRKFVNGLRHVSNVFAVSQFVSFGSTVRLWVSFKLRNGGRELSFV